MNGHRRNQERNVQKKGRKIDIHLGEIINGKDDTQHHSPYVQTTLFLAMSYSKSFVH